MDADTLTVLKSTVLFSILGFVAYKVISMIQNLRSYSKIFNNCPGETDFHWLYGNLHKYPGPNEGGIQYDTESMKKRPRFTRVWAGPFVPVLLFYHPDLIRLLLKSSAPKPRGGLMVSVYEMGLGWLGEGLLLANGSRWARNRRLLTPAFHFDILQSYGTIKNEAADVLLNKLQQYAEKKEVFEVFKHTAGIYRKSKLQQHAERKEAFEVFHHTSLCLFDVLLQCAFAHKSHCQTTGKPWLHFDWLYRLSGEGRQWNKLCDAVHKVSEELINRRRKILEASEDLNHTEGEETTEKKKTLCFVDILLSAKDENGQGMTPLEIRNEADTFLFEGFDTTTSALSWTLYSLARWSEHQIRVQQEVDAILKGRDSDYILCEDLNSLPYMTACIKETIRNYSTVPFIERETLEPLDIDSHIIPAGTFIGVQLWCLHHNPTVWDRPHDFLPERFLGDNVLKMDPFQFVPFSAGSRNCIGQNFAMNELKVMVARIFHRFTLSLDPDHKVLRSPLATFKAEKGIKLMVTPRI